jgi:hypothetical protein
VLAVKTMHLAFALARTAKLKARNDRSFNRTRPSSFDCPVSISALRMTVMAASRRTCV